MKRFIITLTLAAGLCACAAPSTGPAPGPAPAATRAPATATTPAVTSQDVTFIAKLTATGDFPDLTSLQTQTGLTQLGQTVCATLGRGADMPTIRVKLVDNGFSQVQAASIIMASLLAYCPERMPNS